MDAVTSSGNWNTSMVVPIIARSRGPLRFVAFRSYGSATPITQLRGYPMTTAPRKAAKTVKNDAEAQLTSFIDKFEPEHQTTIRAARRTLRKRFPTAIEMVYDNYNFFVIGYSPTERPSDAIISIVGSSNGVGICFIQGARLPDPKKILNGSGKQTRSIHLAAASDLDKTDIKALLAAAETAAVAPFPKNGRGTLVIRSVSAKQRPRRKP
jgi:hypothetical protein